MTAITINGVNHSFGQTLALHEVSLQIKAGELFFLLGPSGCGKSTLLRIIAGLLTPSSGQVLFNNREVTHLPTDQRNAVMCFQSYALWPHMTVAQNVAFGLEVRNLPREQRDSRVLEVLKLVRMEELCDRKPNELSGGQQQRVALARALAVEPACLLLDEPLSNLDAKLRLEMRSEIRRICKTAGFTTIYVTHDQKEALSVADRIAVLKDGELQQVGTPTELYLRPVSAFVAEFIGQTNLLEGEVTAHEASEVVVNTPIGLLRARGSVQPGQKVKVSIRPEHIRIDSGMQQNGLDATLSSSSFLGENSEHVLRIGAVELKAIASPPVLKDAGTVRISMRPEDVVILPK
jgi:ABC-type Fe3+/spermidine/putrescine transport system ATPase subunit